MKIIGLKNLNKQEIFELFSEIQPVELDKALEKEFKQEKEKEKQMLAPEKIEELIKQIEMEEQTVDSKD